MANLQTILLLSIVSLNIGVMIMMIIIYEQLESLDQIYDLLNGGGTIGVTIQNMPIKVQSSGNCNGADCVGF